MLVATLFLLPAQTVIADNPSEKPDISVNIEKYTAGSLQNETPYIL